MEVNAEFQNNRVPGPRDVLDIDESPLPGTQRQPLTFRSLLIQFSATLVVNILAFNYGISIAWAYSAFPVLLSEDTPLSSGPLSHTNMFWLPLSLYIAAFVSVPIFGVYCTIFSRKLVGYIIACVFFTSWIIMSFTNELVLIYIARCLAGIGVGGSLLYVPLYVSEIAEDNIRGILGCIFVLFVNSGIQFGSLIGKYFSYYTQPRIYLIIPPTFMVLFYLFPDTPFYLLKNNRTSEAITALKKLRGGVNYNVTEEISILKESLGSAKSNRSIINMFTSRGIIRGTFLSTTLFVNQQLLGINVILSLTIFAFYDSDTGLSPTVAIIIVGILQLFGALLSCILVELIGRKLLLLVSNSMVVFELGTLGIYLYLNTIGVDVSSWFWYPLKCLFIYVFFFSIGLGSIPFVIMTELLPVQVRSICASVALCSFWGMSFIVAKLLYPIIETFGSHGCCWFFAGCCVLCTIFIVFFIPENKSRKIEEITYDLNYGSWIVGRKITVGINRLN